MWLWLQSCKERSVIAKCENGRRIVSMCYGVRVDEWQQPLSNNVSNRSPNINNAPTCSDLVINFFFAENTTEINIGGFGIIIYVGIRDRLF